MHMAFAVGRDGEAVDVSVYDVSGRRVKTHASGVLGPGRHDGRGHQLPDGESPDVVRSRGQPGAEVAIYEATPELREIGAGVSLGANAMKVLRALGLEDEVRGVAGRSQRRVVRSWNTGRVISETPHEREAVSLSSSAT